MFQDCLRRAEALDRHLLRLAWIHSATLQIVDCRHQVIADFVA
jgi:hypothetical protein